MKSIFTHYSQYNIPYVTEEINVLRDLKYFLLLSIQGGTLIGGCIWKRHHFCCQFHKTFGIRLCFCCSGLHSRFMPDFLYIFDFDLMFCEFGMPIYLCCVVLLQCNLLSRLTKN